MKKILLVDDVKLFLELEKAILKRADLQLFTANSGLEALEIHKREKVDLILLDMYMPIMNGDKICMIIRNDVNLNLKNVPIIMVTTSNKDIDICLKAGANDYLIKPINQAALLKKVANYINIPVRQYERIIVRVGIEGIRSDKSESFIGTTIDISAGGVLIETSHLFTVGEILSCSFFLPDNLMPITVTSKVVRKIACDQPDMNDYGLLFIDIKEEDKQMIDNYIKKHNK